MGKITQIEVLRGSFGGKFQSKWEDGEGCAGGEVGRDLVGEPRQCLPDGKCSPGIMTLCAAEQRVGRVEVRVEVGWR